MDIFLQKLIESLGSFGVVAWVVWYVLRQLLPLITNQMGEMQREIAKMGNNISRQTTALTVLLSEQGKKIVGAVFEEEEK